MTEPQLNEITCVKPVAGTAFPQGDQTFPFSIGAPQIWIPSKSYFRVTMEITGNGGG